MKMKNISTIAALFLSTGAVAADLDIRALVKQIVDTNAPKPVLWVDSNGKVVGREFQGNVVLTIIGDLVPVYITNMNPFDAGKGATWYASVAYYL